MDKFDRLLDAVDHPESYTDEQLDQLLKDEDVREMYMLMCNTKVSRLKELTPDIDAEWETFEKANLLRTSRHRKPAILLFLARHAAAIIISLVVSIAAFAAGIGLKASFDNRRDHNPTITETTEPELPSNKISSSTTSETPKTDKASTIITFKDETFEKIIIQICEYYELELIFKTDSTKELRLYFTWDQKLSPTEIAEMLNNFEQITITLTENKLTIE